MFDFKYVNTPRYPTAQEDICKGLGYDGLAILSTPEALAHAITISYIQNGLFIGLKYKPEFGLAMWDDGTAFRSDTPFNSLPPFTVPNSIGRIIWSMEIAVGGAGHPRPAICGNYKKAPTESVGRTEFGELLTTSRTVLYTSKTLSYLECAVLCGITYECRAAEFNFDLLTCTVIGEYTSSPIVLALLQPANHVSTYIRQTF
ncbi:hypothetical protein ElyMa_005929800 [Elysia marginata]|uniref:Apple domain-containing protein n=1 Tax=Elysia marginata TaxID=1093978 RepID=A0AAV4G7J6_9GAST|nr:hypothetical protein ElyMa_005929800 [Elysia marginata]